MNESKGKSFGMGKYFRYEQSNTPLPEQEMTGLIIFELDQFKKNFSLTLRDVIHAAIHATSPSLRNIEAKKALGLVVKEMETQLNFWEDSLKDLIIQISTSYSKTLVREEIKNINLCRGIISASRTAIRLPENQSFLDDISDIKERLDNTNFS